MAKITIEVDDDEMKTVLLMAQRFHKFSVHMIEHRIARPIGGAPMTFKMLSRMRVCIENIETALAQAGIKDFHSDY